MAFLRIKFRSGRGRRGKKRQQLTVIQIFRFLILLVITCIGLTNWFLLLSLNKSDNTVSSLWGWLPQAEEGLKNEFPDIQRKSSYNDQNYADAWYRKFLANYNYCSDNNNFVADREYVENRPNAVLEDIQRQVPSEKASRAFSLQPQAFQRFHTQDCSTVSQLLQAIQNGQRQWLDPVMQNYPALPADPDDEQMKLKWRSPSYFVPANCHVPILSGRTICNRILAKRFQHVVFLGDSLQRHVYQGFISQIQPDFIRGWMNLATEQMMKDYCYCDGQYSEHKGCRRHDRGLMFHNFNMLQSANYCGGHIGNKSSIQLEDIPTLYMHEVMAPKMLVAEYNNLGHVQCDDDDAGDVLLILNGGLWFQSQVGPTFLKLKEVLRNPRLQACAKRRKLIAIWSSFQTNHPDVHREDKYPHQSPENGHRFNQEMSDLIESIAKHLVIVNFMNMTEGAQVSDGLHYLTDVNTFKSQQLILLAHYMQREGMYYCDKELDETCV